MGRSSPASKAILFEKWYQEASHTLNVCREVLKTSGLALGFQHFFKPPYRNIPEYSLLVFHCTCTLLYFFHLPTVFGFGQSADDRPIVGRQSADDRLICRPTLYSIEPLIIGRCVGRSSPASKAICRRSANCKVLWLIMVIGVVCL